MYSEQVLSIVSLQSAYRKQIPVVYYSLNDKPFQAMRGYGVSSIRGAHHP